MKNKTLMKALSALLAVVMVLCSAPLSGFVGLELPELFGVNASAATYSGSCGDNVNWSLDTETGVLNIAGTGAMYNYEYKSMPWYSYISSVKTVNIADGVTSIGEYAFYYCDSLTSVTIGESVESIGDYAFANCTRLTSITIPDSVTSIGEGMFYCCTSLESVTIGDGVTSIGDDAFIHCTSLTSITIPDSVTNIGGYVFGFCESLISVTIGDSVESIGGGAFADCTSLTSITIPDSVTNIGGYAFGFCDNLTDVYYMGTEEEWNEITIGSDNEDLLNATIHFPREDNGGIVASGECGDNLTWILDENGVLEITGTGEMYNYEYNSVPWYSYNSSVKTINIADGVTSIGTYAFSFCDSLTSVTIGDSVESIGTYAFAFCESLASVTIPDSVINIGDFAFCDCDSITSVTIGDSVESIGNYVFANCTNLTSVIIPDNVTSIGGGVFANCVNLTSVTIPDGVTSIGVGMFANCTSLTSVTIVDGVTNIGGQAFYYCCSLTSVAIPDSVESIGESAFHYCDNLTDVYYMGTEEEWNEITIGSDNEDLLNATIHFLGEEEHSHSYTSEVTKPSTCTEDGVRIYTCSCDDIYTEIIPALGHTPAEAVKEKEVPATESATGSYDSVVYCSVCGDEISRETVTIPVIGSGTTISGNFTAFGEASDATFIALFKESSEETVASLMKSAVTGTYEFENVEDGNYTIVISKKDHVTRTYTVEVVDGEALTQDLKIHLKGDIDGNGKIMVTDYNAILRHVKKTGALEGYAFHCADIDGNGKIMVTDYNAVLRHVKKTSSLW